MKQKIKNFLRYIFAPRITVYTSEKGLSEENWKAIGEDLDKVFEDMHDAFKRMDKFFHKHEK